MADYLDALDTTQVEIATRIAEKAKEMGVPPRLAVAIAMQESGLNPDAPNGQKGEIGIMQVMPGTAKMLGFTQKDLADPNKNIEIGLTYLKQGMEKFGDPKLAAAGYNAGLDHPYFTDPEKHSLPESTIEYLKSIKGLGAFNVPKEPEAEQAPAEDQGVPVEDKRRYVADALGAGAGAVGAKALDVGSSIGKTLGAVQRLPDALKAAAQPAGGLVPTDPMHTRQMQGTTDAGATGRARMNTFNEATAQQAAKQKQAEQVLRMLQQKGIVAGNPMANLPGMTSSPGGIMMPSSAVYPQAAPAPAPKPPLQQAAGAAGRGAMQGLGAVARSPLATGAIGGALATDFAQQAANKYQAGDMPGAAISGAGALGSAMMAAPGIKTKMMGAGMAGLSPIADYLYAKMKEKQQVAPPTPQELQQASRPAFAFPRP